ncbi:putative Zn-dependent protease, partial [Reticulomyxa filosa]
KANYEQFFKNEELDEVIRKIAVPIFKAAKLDSNELKINVIQSKDINAFVTDNKNIFITSDLITFSNDPSVLMGVIAHECGHIASRHITERGANSEIAKTQMLATFILGAAAGLLAKNPEAALGVISGGAHAAQMKLLAHSRTQELEADIAALKFLNVIHASSEGLVNLLKYFNTNQRVFFKEVNPYMLTHPVSKERISLIKRSEYKHDGALEMQEINNNYEMVVAKTFAFTEKFNRTFKKYSGSSKADLYAQSIANYKMGNLPQAISLIDKLLIKDPNNPYYNELKGQFLYEFGKVKESIILYENALKAKPNSSIFKVELAAAMIASKEKAFLSKAISLVRSTVEYDRENYNNWRILGIALGKDQQSLYSQIALAKAYTIIKQFKVAKKFINTIEKNISHDQIKDKFFANAYFEVKQELEKIIASYIFMLGFLGFLAFAYINYTQETAEKVASERFVIKNGKVSNKQGIVDLVKSTIKENPELIIQAVQECQIKKMQDAMEQAKKNVKEKIAVIENNSNDPKVGPDTAKVKVIEFFDYNCGYCKHMANVKSKIIEQNPDIQYIFKELPIMGEASTIASKAALAVYNIDKSKYLPFHIALLKSNNRTEESLINTAGTLGIDLIKLKEELKNPKLNEVINATQNLAGELGIRGTPGYIINGELIPGVISFEQFVAKINQAKIATASNVEVKTTSTQTNKATEQSLPNLESNSPPKESATINADKEKTTASDKPIKVDNSNVNQNIKKEPEAPSLDKNILNSILLIFSIIIFFYLINQVNLIKVYLGSQSDTFHKVNEELYSIKSQQTLLEEILQAFKDAPKNTSEEIIKRSNKFEILKITFLIKSKLTTTNNINQDIQRLNSLIKGDLKEVGNEINNIIASNLKSNIELLETLERIKIVDNSVFDKTYLQKIESLLSKSIRIMKVEEYISERSIMRGLGMAKKAIQNNDIVFALNILLEIESKSPEINDLISLLKTRADLDKNLNLIIEGIVQND